MMTPQEIAVRAVKNAVPGVRVATRMPDPRPDSFVIVSRIGGGAVDWGFRSPRFLVECFARTELGAERLAERVWSRWRNIRGAGVQWASVDNNLARHDDVDPKWSRFQFTATLQLIPQP
ncbi:hypothetical protein QP905_02460 [Corynebacterium pseudodiphtheriticum]|uniref:hypothetical protein n=1 Tax=Corynebacterium pseudodiphtheriticum TaxID=37637 RepID=UPI0025510C33|nr:hypothetical protein [Corynebacterium pseudodiphtheriticum]MDK8577206.1 hypothetical protein [Corynebacterium pseudodiphtheriticum]